MPVAIDFDAISKENRTLYGTRIVRYGRVLLAGLYAYRTHFIFELLQNAEDALRRRESDGPRSVTFEISEDALRVRHYGEPFDEADVRSICGITESTKQEDKTAIGRFGIGFKSVYAWTDRPEIHSGGSDFAIKNYVHPVAAAGIGNAPEETVIILPFKDDAADARDQIVNALSNDASDALRFLREIEAIEWRVNGESSGHYRRETRELDGGARLVTIVESAGSTSSESWLVFSEPAEHDGQHIGHVEIAFAHIPESTDRPARITSAGRSLLYAYFPTNLSTPLSFLIQGPYRTTPARDNVPEKDEWNQALVAQTAELMKPTLIWLREHGYLTVEALARMPIGFLGKSTWFYPLFQAVEDALSNGAFLPAFPGGYVRPEQGLLGGTAALRKLISTDQLKALFDLPDDAVWLAQEITSNRTHNLYDYLHLTLDVREVGTEQVIRQLGGEFLSDQPDAWMRSLYEFLNDQRALREQDWFAGLSLIRLEDGTHVAPSADDPPRVYLPTSDPTDFPTVRRAVCDSKESLDFLKSLGLREPDLVDDVKANILPAYLAEHVSVEDSRYERDLRRIADMHKTTDSSHRDKLIEALRQVKFVRVIDAGSGESTFAKPGDAYMSTDLLKGLFRGLDGVFFVDESVAVLQSDAANRLLAACGVRDRVRVRVREREVNPDDDRWIAVRKRTEWPKSNRGNKVRDRQLDRLSDLLDLLPSANAQRHEEVARLLWGELLRLAARDRDQFFGQYTWFHYDERSQPIEARFVEQLNETAWIPAGDGTLVRPRDVTIESLGWPRDSFVEERIRFQEPADQQTVAQLAEKVGVSVNTLKIAEAIDASGMAAEDAQRILANASQQAPVGGANGPAPAAHSGQSGSSRAEFRSYVQVGRDQPAEADSAGHARRMSLEAKAIQHIRQSEPEWKSTEQGNPGFDLYQIDAGGEGVRWCEVKSLGGGWGEHPVTMSAAQFKFAQDKGDAYWLYVVEHAGDPARINIERIQDPAGLAATFTFDDGWAEIASPTAGNRTRRRL